MTKVIPIDYYTVKQWDGKLPGCYVTGAGSVLPIIGALEGQTEAETEAGGN